MAYSVTNGGLDISCAVVIMKHRAFHTGESVEADAPCRATARKAFPHSNIFYFSAFCIMKKVVLHNHFHFLTLDFKIILCYNVTNNIIN